MQRILNWYRQLQPLNQLLLLGFAARMLSVIFSKGYGWADDHFLIIEPAQNWADGFDNFWLPSPSDPARAPQGHPLLYVWINYVVLKFLMFAGINDPQAKMYFIRFIHTLWSLLIIKYGYRIILHFSDKKTAWYGGLALALFWIFPFLSVRNLAEFVCVPPLIMASWTLIKPGKRDRDYILAGLLIGLAFSMRFQSVLFSTGIGIALLINKTSIKHLAFVLFTFLIFVSITQGLTDYVIWKKPFGEFLAYVEYNINNATNYGQDVWYMYPALLLGLLIPPLSFLLLGGWFYIWKKIPILFWPAFVYLAFHSYFPNKQERFVTTILPSIIIGGVLGMKYLYDAGKFNPQKAFFRYSKYFVLGLNAILLCGLSVSYSKRDRCEAAYYLYKKHDSNNFMLDDSNRDDFAIPPLFYYGKWPSNFGITKINTPDSALKYYKEQNDETRPSYIVFWQAENINARVDSVRKRFPNLTYETTIEPSFIDKLLHWLNPYNDNQTAFIYKINDHIKKDPGK